MTTRPNGVRYNVFACVRVRARVRACVLCVYVCFVCVCARACVCVPSLDRAQVVAYRTSDLQTWEFLGTALPLSARGPGEMMRPHVVFNPSTRLFVMWCVVL